MYRSMMFYVFMFFTFLACQSDLVDQELQTEDANIPSALSPYFETFKQKAFENGFLVDYESANITAELKFIDQGSVAGTCSTNGHDLRHITIDQSFWNQASHLLKEMVVFHELGHCILGRGHEESAFPNGVCRSIMRSGLGNCRDAYIPENRDYFIEELFSSVEGL